MNISTKDVLKLRKEVERLRLANEELKESLHEARQDYLMAIDERNFFKQRLLEY